MNTLYNFSAGPAMLPREVLLRAQEELLNWQNGGISVMEISHRDPAYMRMAEQAELNLRELMAIPEHYHVLFLHGGGRGQFAAVPQNIATPDATVDYLNSGIWSDYAIREAAKFVKHVNVVGGTEQSATGRAVQAENDWRLSDNAAYFHYCPNETVDGVAVHAIPSRVAAPIVADMSSNILSEPLDVSKFGVIYAGAQKNIGPSGFAIAIADKHLIGNPQNELATIMDYKVQAEQGSMYNTPNTFAWYLAGLVFEWLKEQGGVETMGRINAEKARRLYEYIDSSAYYRNEVNPAYRSRMNVPFLLADDKLDAEFLQQAQSHGLLGLKGHRFVGGMRASIYNAMPLEGVDTLIDFMKEFSKKHG